MRIGTIGQQMAEGDDLRIDATGTVHPLGRLASQQLRARAGEWRLLAAPAEIVVAVRAGDGSRPLRLAGEVRSPGALCDVVAMIAQGSWGGELVVHDGDSVRSIYFDRGHVIGRRPACRPSAWARSSGASGPSRARSSRRLSGSRRGRASAWARRRSSWTSWAPRSSSR